MTSGIRRVGLLSCVLFLLASLRAFADAGVFSGNGQSLHQITSKTIQLKSIEVVIVPGRGPFLFDGGVRGMDRAEYVCKFVLHNLSDKPEDIQVGFPIDSQFARGDVAKSAEEAAALSGQWVSEYAFIARDDSATYHVDFIHRKPEKGPGEFSSLFVWKMRFDPGQTRTLSVSYHIPISMGLSSTGKDENGSGSWSQDFAPEQFDLAMMERIGYITSTGSSWAGNVEKATFTVITQPFESYLSQRGVIEKTSESIAASKDLPDPFPAHHPWWFRTIDTPDGKPINGGFQWSYSDYKPKDTIVVSYYFTLFPQRPEETGSFLNHFMASLQPPQKPAAMLTRLREVMLATYGKQPTDPSTRAFVEHQLWYKPRADFAVSSLTPDQKSILATIDARLRKLSGN